MNIIRLLSNILAKDGAGDLGARRVFGAQRSISIERTQGSVPDTYVLCKYLVLKLGQV
jgi:hypothetical protein